MQNLVIKSSNIIFIENQLFLLNNPFMCLFFTKIYSSKYFKKTYSFSLSYIIFRIPKYIDMKNTLKENKYKITVAGKKLSDCICKALLILPTTTSTA
jgi:hypothetical protein